MVVAGLSDRKVHAAGLKTNATMLYGHIESVEDRVDHLLRLRDHRIIPRFQCLIPLAFYPENPTIPLPDRRSGFIEDNGGFAFIAR